MATVKSIVIDLHPSPATLIHLKYATMSLLLSAILVALVVGGGVIGVLYRIETQIRGIRSELSTTTSTMETRLTNDSIKSEMGKGTTPRVLTWKSGRQEDSLADPSEFPSELRETDSPVINLPSDLRNCIICDEPVSLFKIKFFYFILKF